MRGTHSRRHGICYLCMVPVAQLIQPRWTDKDLPPEMWVHLWERCNVGSHAHGWLLLDPTRTSRNNIIYNFPINASFSLQLHVRPLRTSRHFPCQSNVWLLQSFSADSDKSVHDFSNQSASILVQMKRFCHNDLSKECVVLSNIERSTFLLSLMQLPLSKSCW